MLTLSCRQIREFVRGHNSRRLLVAKGKVPGQPAASDMKMMVCSFINNLYLRQCWNVEHHNNARFLLTYIQGFGSTSLRWKKIVGILCVPKHYKIIVKQSPNLKKNLNVSNYLSYFCSMILKGIQSTIFFWNLIKISFFSTT